MNERLEAAFKWCEENKERLKDKRKWSYQKEEHKPKYNRYHREYRAKSIKNLLTDRIRHLINYSLRRKGIERENKCWQLLGYSVKQLLNRLNKTIPEGYNWQDFLDGKLDIDHIKPIKSFNYNTYKDIGFKECWALDNLRLLKISDNRSRRFNKYPKIVSLINKGLSTSRPSLE